MLQTPTVKYKDPYYGQLVIGQLVIGPPGSGKTTYCHLAYEFYKELGRKVAVVNLDPANENMDYTPVVDVMQLITVEEAMEHLQLGPNGALMYCAEYLLKNLEQWLLPKLRETMPTCSYLLFDCPGQVELYTHHTAMATIFERLQREGYNLVTVNLIDSHYCSEPTKFVSTLVLALNMMLRMGLPHVNVLSKADLLRQQESRLQFSLDFYTDVLDLNYLLEALDDTPSMRKYHKLNAAICSMVEDYALVSFQLLDARNHESMLRLRNHVDKANGYAFRAAEESSVNTLLACAVQAEPEAERLANDMDPYEAMHK